MSLRKLVLVCLLLLAVATPLTAVVQQTTDNSSQQGPPPLMPQRPSPEDEARQRMEKDMAKKANQERWQQLKRDTDSLVKLSNELKEYVDKANENTLSLDVIKKADQIEKLAHSVKEKMKGD